MLLTWHMPSKSVHKHGGCGHGGDKPKGLQNQERIFASTLGRSHSRCTENKPFELFVTQTSSSAHTYATTPRRRFSVIERPPGVPFQKIQFGNERGGRSVLSRLPELRIARILALLRCLILRPSVSPSQGNLSTRKKICLLGNNPQKNEFLLAS